MGPSEGYHRHFLCPKSRSSFLWSRLPPSKLQVLPFPPESYPIQGEVCTNGENVLCFYHMADKWKALLESDSFCVLHLGMQKSHTACATCGTEPMTKCTHVPPSLHASFQSATRRKGKAEPERGALKCVHNSCQPWPLSPTWSIFCQLS